MEISLAYQLIAFSTSVGLGLILGFIFDFFKIIELFLRKKELKIFFVDVIYFVFCAFISFLYMMVVSSGEIRLFYIIGEFAGWFLYHFTFGRYNFFMWKKLAMFLMRKLLKLKGVCGRFIKAKELKKFLNSFFVRKKNS